MDESISAAETSIASRKRRGKYCAAFGCNNSAYDADGIRTSYHFFEFPKDAHRRNRLCPHQEAAWTRWICSFHHYCPLPWTFLSRRYKEKYLWSLAFEEWLWDFSAFVMPLLCLHDNSAVCVSAFGYLKLQKPKIFRFVLTRVRILHQITDFPVWLNCRILCLWFTCYWITIVSIVSWLERR